MKNIKHDGRNSENLPLLYVLNQLLVNPRNPPLPHITVTSCKHANWPGSLPVRGLLTFDFNSKRVRKILSVRQPPADPCGKEALYLAIKDQMDARRCSSPG